MSAGLDRIDSSHLFSDDLFNAVPDALERMVAFSLGRGVISGLVLSDAGTFSLAFTSGWAYNGYKPVQVSSGAENAPASQVSYVWLTPDTGDLNFYVSAADPGGSAVCLGRVTTNGTEITLVETVGRVEALRWTDAWTLKVGQDDLLVADLLNGRVGIGKVPTVLLDVDGALAATSIDAGTGSLDVIEVPQSGSAPGTPSNAVKLYAKDVSGTAELFMIGEGGVEVQLTSGGYPLAMRPVYTQTSIQANDTRNNSTAENLFPSKHTLGANSLRVGQVLEGEVFGSVGSDAVTPGTLTLKVKGGSVVLGSTGAVTLGAGLSGRGWWLRFRVTVISLGATGTVEVQGVGMIAGTPVELVNTAVITVDTTAAIDLQLSEQFSVADADNTITMRSLGVKSS